MAMKKVNQLMEMTDFDKMEASKKTAKGLKQQRKIIA